MGEGSTCSVVNCVRLGVFKQHGVRSDCGGNGIRERFCYAVALRLSTEKRTQAGC